MQCNPAAIAIIKYYEGFSSTPYKCPAGYWTYGYGNIRDAQGERVTSDTEHITELEGETLLLEEMAKVERQIKALTTAELTVKIGRAHV